MQYIFSVLKNTTLIATPFRLRTIATKSVVMAASSSYDVYIPSDTIPTAGTKITLAGRILVSPLGTQWTYWRTSCVRSYTSVTVLGTWAWGDKKQWDWNEELDAKAKEAFEMSISKGINAFDTAEVYGNGER